MSSRHTPEPIEFYMHLRVFHPPIAMPFYEDWLMAVLHTADHDAPRSLAHHSDEYPIARIGQEVIAS